MFGTGTGTVTIISTTTIMIISSALTAAMPPADSLVNGKPAHREHCQMVMLQELTQVNHFICVSGQTKLWCHVSVEIYLANK